MDPIIAIEIGSAMITAACVEGGEITKQHQTTMPRTGHGGDLANAIADLVRKITSALSGLASPHPVSLPMAASHPSIRRPCRSKTTTRSPLHCDDVLVFMPWWSMMRRPQPFTRAG